MISRTFVRFSLIGGAVLAAGCKGGGSEPKPVGPPSQLAVSAGALTAPANTQITTPIVITVQDANGKPVSGEIVTFAVVLGGGSLTGSATATSDADGKVTAPAWRLGKSASPQRMRATVGSTITKDIDATVQTAFNIIVRYFGSQTPTPAQQALFTNAAQRIMGMVTGDVTDLPAQPIDMNQCPTPVPVVLNELIDDVIIYASVVPIDGKGKILGSAGPCYIRDPGIHATITGVMKFDSDDIDDLLTQGLAQDVITHEMLHVLGIGTLWELTQTSPQVHLLQGQGSSDPRYTGEQGRQGCLAGSGTVTCATNVPVEGSAAGPGTQDSHWRESTFGTELMTGFINTGTNPLSALTLRSLADLGYTMNTADADAYTIPAGLLRADASDAIALSGTWEQVHRPAFTIDRAGRITALPRPK